jgi:acetyl esterase/lipase
MTKTRNYIIPVFSIILLVAASMASAQDFPKRETFTFPPELEALTTGLVEAGINIKYGPNPVPAPEGISDAAKQVWVKLPQLPFPVDPKELAAVRAFLAFLEDASFEKFKSLYSLEDREINGTTTLWTTPPQLTHDDKVIVFIHGGGYVLQTRKAQIDLQVAVADSLGVRVVSIEYPLAPEAKYPVAVNAIIAAYKGVIDEYGAENTGLFGTSAGGGLTLETLLHLKADGVPLPAASAPLSPAADLTGSGYLYRGVGLEDPILPPLGLFHAYQGYVGDADPRGPLINPVFGDYSGMTPLFLLAGTGEILASDAIRVAAKARGQGVDVTLLVTDGMWHVPIGNGSGVPELQLAYDEMIKFFKLKMGL